MILDWSDDAANAIGSEYIIMEHAAGIPLYEKWPTMCVADQIACVKAICETLKEMVDLDFPAYGSLYFADTPYLTAPTIALSPEFCIGPHCGGIYWDCQVGQSKYYHHVEPDRGPWPDLAAYSNALVDAGISRIPPSGPPPKLPRYHGSTETHHQLLNHARAVLRQIAADPRVQNAATPLLFHPDLHKRNIFVSDADPTAITAILDWQASSIEPAFWYADAVPDFAQPAPDPRDEAQIEPKSEACAQAFEVCLQFLAPKLSAARSMDDALFRPFRYCHRTWEDGTVALREELIQTSLHWEELGFAGRCPYPIPCPEELEAHRKDYRLFEAAQQLRCSLAGLLNTASDGWVPAEEWEATGLAQREMFEGLRGEVLGNEQPEEDEPVRNEDDVREIWPFDLDD